MHAKLRSWLLRRRYPSRVCNERVCLSVCLSVCLFVRTHLRNHNSKQTSPIFLSTQSVDRFLAASRCVTYFRFWGWRYVCTRWRRTGDAKKWRTLEVTRQMAEPTVLLRLSKHPTTLFAIQAALLRITGWIKASGITILTWFRSK